MSVAIPMEEVFHENYIQGKVKELNLEGNKVVIDKQGQTEEIDFTHCIVAVGSVGPVPARTDKVNALNSNIVCKILYN